MSRVCFIGRGPEPPDCPLWVELNYENQLENSQKDIKEFFHLQCFFSNLDPNAPELQDQVPIMKILSLLQRKRVLNVETP